MWRREKKAEGAGKEAHHHNHTKPGQNGSLIVSGRGENMKKKTAHIDINQLRVGNRKGKLDMLR
jgi:hypothetical protein